MRQTADGKLHDAPSPEGCGHANLRGEELFTAPVRHFAKNRSFLQDLIGDCVHDCCAPERCLNTRDRCKEAPQPECAAVRRISACALSGRPHAAPCQSARLLCDLNRTHGWRRWEETSPSEMRIRKCPDPHYRQSTANHKAEKLRGSRRQKMWRTQSCVYQERFPLRAIAAASPRP